MKRLISILAALSICTGFLFSGSGFAAPKIKAPTWRELLNMDLVAKARIRWNVIEKDGKHTYVEVSGGEATRLNPGWSADPARLKYDLARNRALADAVKGARLGPPTARTPRPGDRVLELWAEGDTAWEMVGSWSGPLSWWQKGPRAQIAEMFEPLLKVQADVFNTR
jgi:hypothetical protein